MFSQKIKPNFYSPPLRPIEPSLDSVGAAVSVEFSLSQRSMRAHPFSPIGSLQYMNGARVLFVNTSNQTANRREGDGLHPLLYIALIYSHMLPPSPVALP